MFYEYEGAIIIQFISSRTNQPADPDNNCDGIA